MTWKTTILTAGTVAFGGITMAVAATAGADVAATPDFSGQYAYTYTGGAGGFATTWNVAPCGQGCVHINTASGLTDTDAHLSGGRWVFERYDDAGIVCDNHKLMAATVRFSVDPQTLKGELQPIGKPCGGTSRMTTFTLNKLG